MAAGSHHYVVVASSRHLFVDIGRSPKRLIQTSVQHAGLTSTYQLQFAFYKHQSLHKLKEQPLKPTEQALQQYQQLQENAAWFELGSTVVKITGADRHLFLHNFCTNEIKGLRGRQRMRGFYSQW